MFQRAFKSVAVQEIFQHFSNANSKNLINNSKKCASICNYSTSISNTKDNPGKVVFISQSTNVYDNLAFEDWLYQNWTFDKRYVLFLWRNSPCVVIGRHQNPYIEANLDYLASADVPVVRRNSGGGTVYHDDGNLNCTFFTPKEKYNRRWNLELIRDTLKKDFGIFSQINKKDDIVIGDSQKISGTAAKLGRLCAYHHCTILVSADKLQLKLALKGDKTLKSKATASVASPIANLQEICPEMSVEKLLASIGKSFLERSLTPGSENPVDNYRKSDGFTLINPTEEWFPGIDVIKSKLMSWNWFYGMTPLFKITRPVSIEDIFSEGSSILVTAEVYHGLIKDIVVASKVGTVLRELVENQIGNGIKGSQFTPDLFLEIESRLLERNMKPKYLSVK